MTLVVKRVLEIAPLRLDDPRANELTHRFALAQKGGGEWATLVTELGLLPHVLDVDCTHCREGHIAIVGYGEVQPARYLALLQGIHCKGDARNRP
jgi:hypothetical protein